MLEICNNYNKISISGQFDLFKWVPDGPEPHGYKIGLRAPQKGPI